MSVVASQLVVKITTDASEAKSGLKGMNDEIGQSSGLFSGLLGNMLSFAGGIGIVNAVGGAFGFVKDQLVDSYKAGMDANSIQAQITAGLKSTRDASGETTDALDQYATTLSDTTGVAKDAVGTAQAMLLTFTGIGKGAFPDATQAALDMATKFNGGVLPSAQQTQQQALLLGKALNDPTKGITALTREGVTFTDAQKKQIETLQKSGDTLGAQKIILGELNKEFGGSAVAAGQANGGFALLNAQWTNMKEQLGQQLIPVVSQLLTSFAPIITAAGNLLPGALAALSSFITANVVPAINQLSGWIKTDGMPDLTQLGNFIQTTVVPALKSMQEWTQKYVVPALEQLGAFVMNVVLPAAKQLAQWFFEHVLPVLKQVAQIILVNVLPALEGVATTVLTKLLPALEHLWNVLAPILVPILQLLGWILQNVVGPAISIVISDIAGVVDAFASFIGGIEKFVSNPSVNNFIGILKNIANLGQQVMNTMSGGLIGQLTGGHLPHFASGGTMAQSGLALVGENGPEIVALPGGSQVFPNGSLPTPQSFAGASGGSTGPIYLQIDGRTFARVVMPHLTQGIYNVSGARGVVA